MRTITITKKWQAGAAYITSATDLQSKLELVQVFGDQWVIGKHDNQAMIELCQGLIQIGCHYELSKPKQPNNQ
jgi:hypothetical protein